MELGSFSLCPATTSGRFSALPVALTDDVIAALTDIIEKKLQIELTEEGGIIKLKRNKTERVEELKFTFSETFPSSTVLKQTGRSLESLVVQDESNAVKTGLKVNERMKSGEENHVLKVNERMNSSENHVLKLNERMNSSENHAFKVNDGIKSDDRNHKSEFGKAISGEGQNSAKEKVRQKRKHSVETPESGYGTGSSSRLGEFEEEDKLQDVDELSDETPFKKCKPPKPSSHSKNQHEHSRAGQHVTQPGQRTLAHSREKKAVAKDLKRLHLPPPQKKSSPAKNVSTNLTNIMHYPNVDTSFLFKYPPIKTSKDRDAYKVEFEKTYSTYRDLEKKLGDRMEEWKRLRIIFDETGAEEVGRKMLQLRDESDKDSAVPHYKYIYEKLCHLKRACSEWDSRPL